MNNRLVLITLLFAGSTFCAEKPKVPMTPLIKKGMITVNCAKSTISLPVDIAKAFDYFEHFIEAFDSTTEKEDVSSSISLIPSPEDNAVCSLNAKSEFCLHCSKDVFQILIDIIKGKGETHKYSLRNLKVKDLASLIFTATDLGLKEPFSTELQVRLTPIFLHPELIPEFFSCNATTVQEIINTLDWIGWEKDLIPSLYLTTKKYRIPAIPRTDQFLNVQLSPDNSLIATSVRTYDETYVTNVTTRKTGETILTVNGNHFTFSPNSTYCAIEEKPRTITVLASKTGKIIHRITFSQSASSIAFSPDETLLAIGKAYGTIEIISIKTGEKIGAIDCSDTIVRSITFSPNGELFATELAKSELQVINIKTGKRLYTMKTGTHFIPIVFSPDGTLLATGGTHDNQIKITDMTTGATISADDNLGASYVCFSPDGTLLALGGHYHRMGNDKVRMVDTKTGKTIYEISKHTNLITSIVFSPDGTLLATGSLDRTAKVTNLSTDEKETLCIINHYNPVSFVSFNADGNLFSLEERSVYVTNIKLYTPLETILMRALENDKVDSTLSKSLQNVLDKMHKRFTKKS